MGPFGIVYLPDAKEQDQNKNTQFEPDPHAVPPLPGRPQIDASGLLARAVILSWRCTLAQARAVLVQCQWMASFLAMTGRRRDDWAGRNDHPPSLRGAQRRGNPCLCVIADGLLRSSH